MATGIEGMKHFHLEAERTSNPEERVETRLYPAWTPPENVSEHQCTVRPGQSLSFLVWEVERIASASYVGAMDTKWGWVMASTLEKEVTMSSSHKHTQPHNQPSSPCAPSPAESAQLSSSALSNDDDSIQWGQRIHWAPLGSPRFVGETRSLVISPAWRTFWDEAVRDYTWLIWADLTRGT